MLWGCTPALEDVKEALTLRAGIMLLPPVAVRFPEARECAWLGVLLFATQLETASFIFRGGGR